MTQNNEAIEKLNQLLLINANTEKVYLEALDATTDEELKQFFRARAFERNEFCRYLGAEIRILGGTPSFSEELIDAKIIWPDLKKTVATKNPKTLFTEINRLKTLCLTHYNKALSSVNFSSNLSNLLEKQKQTIGTSISLLRYNDNWSRSAKLASNS